MNDRMNGGRVTYLFTKTFFHCVSSRFYFRQLFTDVFITLNVNGENSHACGNIFFTFLSLRNCQGKLILFFESDD